MIPIPIDKTRDYLVLAWLWGTGVVALALLPFVMLYDRIKEEDDGQE